MGFYLNIKSSKRSGFDMWIYSITNNINGKEYIGKTTREDFRRRWCEHQKQARKNKNYPLYNSIRKYGIENFEFKPLLKCANIYELAEKETEFIINHNTLAPNGYNLVYFQEAQIRSSSFKEKVSKAQQGTIKRKLNRVSKYIGVGRDRKSWNCEISRNTIKYKRAFGTEEDAARNYDKMAIYLYGKDAKVNFDNRNYTEIELKNTFEYFNTNQTSSIYSGVHWANQKKRWRVSLLLNNKRIHIKYTKLEIDAAELFDLATLYYKTNSKLNFPEKIEQYLKIDLDKMFKKKQKSSKYKGVIFYKAYNKFSAKFELNKKTYFCGYHDTEELAYNAILEKKKIINENTI